MKELPEKRPEGEARPDEAPDDGGAVSAPRADRAGDAAEATPEPEPGPGPAAEAAPAIEPDEPGVEPAGDEPDSASPEEPGFAEMLDASLTASEPAEGETVRGIVSAIGADVAFVDIGGKSEATIGLEELRDEKGELAIEVGKPVEAIVVSTEEGTKLSRRLARGAASRERLAAAQKSGLPVEGRVVKTNKGGYEVRIAGQRAFCPFSQMDLTRAADPEIHVGKVYEFRVSECRESGKNIVLSRRALLHEEARKRAELARESVVPGAVLTGRVVTVLDYGAFVDLGGVQGLLHVSEMAWGRVTKPAEIVKPGDEITVKVLGVEEAKGRISLGLKQLQENPWSRAAESYQVGRVYPGRVLRLQEFGAFVELEPGIEALAHASTFPPAGPAGGWKKTIPKGREGMFEVLSIDAERQRIGVALVEEGSVRAGRASEGEDSGGEAGEAASGDDAAAGGAAVAGSRANGDGGAAGAGIVPGARLTGRVDGHQSYGVFIQIAPGRTGLMPAVESGTPRGADLSKEFPLGSQIEVAVLEVDEARKRIRLSRRALLEPAGAGAGERSQRGSGPRGGGSRPGGRGMRREARGGRGGGRAGRGQRDERTWDRDAADSAVSSSGSREAFGSISDKLREALEKMKK